MLEAARKSTTFSSAASEMGILPVATPPAKPRGTRLIVGAGAVVLAGTIAVIVATRPKPTATSEPPAAEEVPAAAVERPRADPAVKEPAVRTEPEVPTPPPTVRIDIQGVPPQTALTVDGQPASFPLELPRGTRAHRVVLKPPGVPEKVLEVDGTRDRLIELVFEAPQSGRERNPGRAAEKSGERSTGRRSSRERAGTSDKNPAPRGASDREAITDI